MTEKSVPKSLDTLFLGEGKDSEESTSKPEGSSRKMGRSISFGDVFVKNKIAEKALAEAESQNSKDDSVLPTGTGSGGQQVETSASGDLKTKRSREQLLPPPSLTLPEPSERGKDNGPSSARGGSGLPSLDLTSSAPVPNPGRPSTDRSPSKTERERGVKKSKTLAGVINSPKGMASSDSCEPGFTRTGSARKRDSDQNNLHAKYDELTKKQSFASKKKDLEAKLKKSTDGTGSSELKIRPVSDTRKKEGKIVTKTRRSISNSAITTSGSIAEDPEDFGSEDDEYEQVSLNIVRFVSGTFAEPWAKMSNDQKREFYAQILKHVQALPSINDHLFGLSSPGDRDFRVSLSQSNITGSAGLSTFKSSSDPEFDTSGDSVDVASGGGGSRVTLSLTTTDDDKSTASMDSRPSLTGKESKKERKEEKQKEKEREKEREREAKELKEREKELKELREKLDKKEKKGKDKGEKADKESKTPDSLLSPRGGNNSEEVDLSNGSANPYITLDKDPAGKSIRSTKRGRKNLGRANSRMSVMIGKDPIRAGKNPLFAETESLAGLTPRSHAAKFLHDEALALLNRLYQFQVENQTFFMESVARGRPTDNSIFPMIDLRDDLYLSIRNINLQLRKIIVFPPSLSWCKDAPSDNLVAQQKATQTELEKPFNGTAAQFKSKILCEFLHISFAKKILLEQLIELYRCLYYAFAQYLTAFCLVEEANQGFFSSLLTCAVTLRQMLQKTADLVETFYFLTSAESKLLRLKAAQSKSCSNSPNASGHDAVTLKFKNSESANSESSAVHVTTSGPGDASVPHVTQPALASEPQPIDKAIETFDELEFGNPKDPYRDGTIYNIVVRLTGIPDMDFQDVILLGYAAIIEPRKLWESLRDRYLFLKAEMLPESKIFRMRALKLIRQWVHTDVHLMNQDLKDDIKTFCETVLSLEDVGVNNKISAEIANELNHNQDFWQIKTAPINYTDIPVFELCCTSADYILTYEEPVIAAHLAAIHFNIYKDIAFNELVDQKWSKEVDNFFSPHVLALIARIEMLSYWVGTVILSVPKVKDRVKVLTKIIALCEALLFLNDFNGVLGVLNGLALSPVSRLKHTWHLLNHKVDETYKAMAHTMDPTKSFNNLREQMKANKVDQSMPCLAVFLGDLISLDQNADFVQAINPKTNEPVTLINVGKLRMVTQTISTVIQSTRVAATKYVMEKVDEPLMSFLSVMPGMDIQTLQNLSLEREPRDTEFKNIQ